jgi:hypothetical protein
MGIQKDKLSKEQKAEIERLRQFIARNGLDARMNGTKWRQAIDAITAASASAPEYRFRCVTDSADPGPQAWRGDFPAGLPLYNAIEWIEIKRSPSSTPIATALTAVRVPAEETPGGIRIVGYARRERKSVGR